MRQFTPSTEVDFVVIGSGAAGDITAEQLWVAVEPVVVVIMTGDYMGGSEVDNTRCGATSRSSSTGQSPV